MAYINGNKIPAILRKGDKGDKGDNTFIRYSAYADGTDFTKTWGAGQTYIGFATGQIPPTDKSGYEWVALNVGEAKEVAERAEAAADRAEAAAEGLETALGSYITDIDTLVGEGV